MKELDRKINLDSVSTAFFARELEYIKARTYDVEYPQLKATMVLPVSFEAGPGAESITYQQFDQLGIAKIIANYADDLPRSDIKGKEFTVPVRSIGASYGYSLQEIRAAQFAGRNLEQRKANAARRAVEQKINKVGFFGDEEFGLTGFLNNPNITRSAAALNAGATSTKWSNKTPDEILKDMNDAVNGVVDLTNGVEAPNTMLLPIEQYTYIASTARSANSDTTILQYFLTNNPFIQTVDHLYELKGAGLGADALDAGEDMMIVYDNSPDKLTFEIPQPFEQFQIEQRGLEYLVPCHARVSSVIIYYPLSVAVVEGI
jgi:hypothetical protein